MGWSWRRALGVEQRMITSITGDSIERPGSNILNVLGIGDVALPNVTIESALTVPAFSAASTFLPRTMSAIPLHAFRNTPDGPVRISGALETIIHEAPNPEWTSQKLRQHFWHQVFTGGRGLLWIERSGNSIVGLWPIDPCNVEIKRTAKGVTTYKVGSKTYQSSEIIDVPFLLKSDGLGHYGPINLGAKAIQLALAMNQYGSTFFAGGGVPPLAVKGPMEDGKEAMKRALTQIQQSIEAARETSIPIAKMPPGYDLTPIGFDPEKGQMTDARRFQVEEIARVFNLPPVFLQDLTHGTFSNTEQQDLHLVKHLVAQWAEAFEQELNLKLFGQRNGGRFVEHTLDGLLRGDFKSRMEAHASSVQNAIRTPNEVRALENLPPLKNGDDLMIQGATVPLGAQPTNEPGTPPPADGGLDDDGA
jgi:HK97 family phage portal protein